MLNFGLASAAAPACERLLTMQLDPAALARLTARPELPAQWAELTTARAQNAERVADLTREARHHEEGRDEIGLTAVGAMWSRTGLGLTRDQRRYAAHRRAGARATAHLRGEHEAQLDLIRRAQKLILHEVGDVDPRARELVTRLWAVESVERDIASARDLLSHAWRDLSEMRRDESYWRMSHNPDLVGLAFLRDDRIESQLRGLNQELAVIRGKVSGLGLDVGLKSPGASRDSALATGEIAAELSALAGEMRRAAVALEFKVEALLRDVAAAFAFSFGEGSGTLRE